MRRRKKPHARGGGTLQSESECSNQLFKRMFTKSHKRIPFMIYNKITKNLHKYGY